MALLGQVFGPFVVPNKATIGQYIGFRIFSQNVSTGFTRNLLIVTTFVCVQKIDPVGPNFWAILGLQMSQNSGFRPFCYKSFPLDQLTSVLLYMLISEIFLANFWAILDPKYVKILDLGHILRTFSGMWNMGFRAPILAPFFGPQISRNSGLWAFSQIVFTGFTSVLLHMLIASAYRCVQNVGIRGPILGPLWAPNK